MKPAPPVMMNLGLDAVVVFGHSRIETWLNDRQFLCLDARHDSRNWQVIK